MLKGSTQPRFHLTSSPLSRERTQEASLSSKWLDGLSLPRLDFDVVLAEQLEAVRYLKEGFISRPDWKQRIMSVLEGPWAPERVDLPERSPTSFGHEKGAFRVSAPDRDTALRRQMVKERIGESERIWSLTPWTSVYEYDVPISALPKPLQGLTILHLSDIHFLKSSDRPWREMSRVAEYLERGERRVDLILLSGDVITKGPEDLCKQSLRQLQRLSDVCPQSFMVHGNHDYHGHLPAIISKQLQEVGFYDINNHHIRLTIDGAPLNIFGVDDAYFGNPTPPSSIEPGETNIVLTHNLDAIRDDFPRDIDLILSGHTHWGEVRFFDGARVMKWWGYSENANSHTKHWDMLTDRTRSYVHPGLARYYIPFAELRHPPGVVIHTLRSDESLREVS
jgi:predicted MPP superfamily phosphohydrolase